MLRTTYRQGPVQRMGRIHALLIGMMLFFPLVTCAQTWTWNIETVDTSARFTSLAVDKQGNVHVSYSDGDSRELRYAFRPAGVSRWFTMILDKQLPEFSTHLVLDSQGNPHICYTPRMLKYAHWTGKSWNIQRIEPVGVIEFSCSLVIAPDGTPHVTWYQTRGADGQGYLHLKYAVLQDGVWRARTIDFEGEAGKWSSIVLDAQGHPSISYSRFPTCVLKLAQWDGKNWNITIVDSDTIDHVEGNRGMGNSIVLDAAGKLHISYYHNEALRYAEQRGSRWVLQTVDPVLTFGGWVGFWSRLVLDHQGHPHISYDDGGALKHAYWDGKQWHIQLIAAAGMDPFRYSAIGIGPDDTIYISFRDPVDGSLQVAVGRPPTPSVTTAAPTAGK